MIYYSKNIVLIFFLIPLFFYQCGSGTPVATAATKLPWNYTDQAAWATNYPQCGGVEQSPVDIVNTAYGTPLVPVNVTAAGASALTYTYVSAPIKVWNFINNGHTLMSEDLSLPVNVSIISVPTNNTRGVISGTNSFSLLNYHFHAPAEHTINGQVFDMEMHMVHQFTDPVSGAPRLAIVAILMNSVTNDTVAFQTAAGMTSTASLNMESLLTRITTDLTGKAIDAAVTPGVAPTDFIQADPKAMLDDISTAQGHTGTLAYYNYQGSIEMPPCVENVDEWVIITKSVTIPDALLTAFHLFYNGNIRSIQPLGTRVINSFN